MSATLDDRMAEAEPDRVADINDAATVTAQRRKARLAARARDDALAGMMSIREGRAWVHDLLATSHVFESSFSNNPGLMAFREGERNVGLRVLAQVMRLAPDRYVDMMKENAA